MSPPTAPSSPTDFEDQVAAALHRRAAPVKAEAGARAAIDRRIVHRTRVRRARRVGVAAITAVVLIAAALAVAQRGRDDASVVTGPGSPVVELPQLGLPPKIGRNQIMGYVPGRSLQSLLVRGPNENGATTASSVTPETSTAAVAGSAFLELHVTDASLEAAAAAEPASAAPVPVTISGQRGYWIASLPGGTGSPGVVVWQPAAHVIAELAVQLAPAEGDPVASAVSTADALVELDDATWWTLLNPDPSAEWLGLSGSDGSGELAAYSPNQAGSSAMTVLDARGWPPGTFLLSSGPTGGRSPQDLFDAVDGKDHVDVRGTSGLISDAAGYLTSAFGVTQSLRWVEDGTLYVIDFSDAASPADAVTVAERLATLTSEEWHALLLPTALRTDLVPMPVYPQTVVDQGPAATTTTGG